MSLVEDAAGNRFKETNTFNGETALLLGAYEKRTQGGITTHLHHIAAGGQTIAIVESKSNGTQTTQYLHRDHLGSVTAITNEAGQLQERLSYDAWGKRRESNWQDATTQLTSSQTPRGYTGHEHLDDTSLIHMNGRVYDPDLGRFTRADPFVQAPYYSQSLNRYSYVGNGPLSATDPSGYLVSFLNCARASVGYGMTGQDEDVMSEACISDLHFQARINEAWARRDGDVLGVMASLAQQDVLNLMQFDRFVVNAQYASTPVFASGEQYAWASKQGAYVHQRATYRVIGQHLSKGENAILARAQMYADSPQFQGESTAHRHAMRNPHQTIDQARVAAHDFVRAQFARAWSAETREEALFQFAVALHVMQDSTSPAHAGFQVWSDDRGFFEQDVPHVSQELFDPGPGSALYRATEAAWGWYQTGHLPEGDLFIFGHD